MRNIIEVSLIKEIVFYCWGKEIIIPAETFVDFDIKNNLGFWKGMWFDLSRDEFNMSQ